MPREIVANDLDDFLTGCRRLGAVFMEGVLTCGSESYLVFRISLIGCNDLSLGYP